MVGKCEVTWAGAGRNKNDNDDGRDSDDRDDDGDYSFSFICMGLKTDIIIAMVTIFMTIIIVSLNQVGRAGGATVNATRFTNKNHLFPRSRAS